MELHTSQNLCHFGHYVAKAKLFSSRISLRSLAVRFFGLVETSSEAAKTSYADYPGFPGLSVYIGKFSFWLPRSWLCSSLVQTEISVTEPATEPPCHVITSIFLQSRLPWGEILIWMTKAAWRSVTQGSKKCTQIAAKAWEYFCYIIIEINYLC